MSVSVVHTDRVNLFFVTFDAMGRTDVISEQPGVSRLACARKLICGATSKNGRADKSKIPVDCVFLDERPAIVVSLMLHS